MQFIKLGVVAERSKGVISNSSKENALGPRFKEQRDQYLPWSEKRSTKNLGRLHLQAPGTSKRYLLSSSKTPILGVKSWGYLQKGRWLKNAIYNTEKLMNLIFSRCCSWIFGDSLRSLQQWLGAAAITQSLMSFLVGFETFIFFTTKHMTWH